MKAKERESWRTCLGCRTRRPRRDVTRIVRGPDGAACFDVEGRLPGRGAWVCPTPACLDALSAGALGHVLRAPVRLPSPSARRGLLAAALLRRIENLVTMSRRLRGVRFGATGARAAIAEGRARLLVLAADVPADTVASWSARAAGVPLLLVPDAATIGSLAGRAPAIVAAFTDAGLAAALAQPLELMHAFWAFSCDNEKIVVEKTSQTAPGGAAAGGG